MRGFGIKDPTKRKKTIKFLIVLLIIGVSVGVISSIFQGFLGQSDPLKVCINDRNTTYKISATLELHVDETKLTFLQILDLIMLRRMVFLILYAKELCTQLQVMELSMQNGKRNGHLRLGIFSGFGISH